MTEHKTTLTLTNEYGSYSITVYKNDLTVDNIIEDLFEPILFAAGYHMTLEEYYSVDG